MTRTAGRLGIEDRDALFPEFRDQDVPLTEEEVAQEPAAADVREPLILSVMAKLAHVLAEETRLLRAGDFEGFSALQREKGLLIRQAERMEHSKSAARGVAEFDQAIIRERLDSFNEAVESNMRAIGAVKDAVTHVRSQAIRKLEEEKGDGVYSRDGGKKSLHHLSLNETQVKL